MTLHDQLLLAWKLSDFGVKTRVFKIHPQQNVNYILKTPNYKGEAKIQAIINCIKSNASDVMDQARTMHEKIESI